MTKASMCEKARGRVVNIKIDTTEWWEKHLWRTVQRIFLTSH